MNFSRLFQISLILTFLLAAALFAAGCGRPEAAPYTRAQVLAQGEQDFAAEQREEAIALLDNYGVEDYERERERVQIAILNLAAGDLNQVRELVELAKVDYRDVLSMAEYE